MSGGSILSILIDDRPNSTWIMKRGNFDDSPEHLYDFRSNGSFFNHGSSSISFDEKNLVCTLIL